MYRCHVLALHIRKMNAMKVLQGYVLAHKKPKVSEY